MKVISNTSPLIFLSKLDALTIVQQCFETIIIPKAVETELKGLVLPEFIVSKSISNSGAAFVQGALGRLHTGELEAIMLAEETKADLILLDDLAARNMAKRLDLTVMGTVGVLKLANSKSILSASETLAYYDELIEKHGLYLSPKILKKLKETLS